MLTQLQHTQFINIVLLLGIDKFHEVALGNRAVQNLKIDNDATERVEHRVKDQCLQRRLGVTLRRWDAIHYRVKYGRYTLARTGTAPDDVAGVAAQEFDNLILDFIGMGAIHIDLVDDRYDFQPVVYSHI